MKKRLFILFLAGVLSMTAYGCGKKASEADESDEGFTSEYGAYSEGAEWGNNYEGSAVYVDGTTAVVTIAVTAQGEEFQKSDIDVMKENTQKALDFIVKSVKEFGKESEFIFGEEDLCYSTEYETEDIDDFEAEDYDTFLEEYIAENIDTKKIREKYKADGIAYLVYLNGCGEPFVSAHWQEDEDFYQNECAYVFSQCYDDNYEETTAGPDVYLNGILQLFGAVPLTYPDATYGYTASLFEDVMYYYGNDALYSYYDDEGGIAEDEITKEITDITAYSLGIIDTFDELSDNPSFTKKYRACFTDDYMANTKDGEDESLYELEDDFGDEMYDADGDGIGDYEVEWEEVEEDEDSDEEEFYIEEDLGEAPAEEAVTN